MYGCCRCRASFFQRRFEGGECTSRNEHDNLARADVLERAFCKSTEASMVPRMLSLAFMYSCGIYTVSETASYLLAVHMNSICICMYVCMYTYIHADALNYSHECFMKTELSLFVCLPIDLSIYLSVCLSLSVFLSVRLSVCLSVFLSVHVFIIRLSTSLFICLSVCLSVYRSTYPSTFLPTYLSIYLSIYASIYLPTPHSPMIQLLGCRPPPPKVGCSGSDPSSPLHRGRAGRR